jgi:hypothetical protein
MYRIYLLLLLVTSFLEGHSQQLSLHEASDPASMVSRATVDIESYFFENGSVFYALRPGFYYGLRNGRHLLGMSIPWMHNVFEGDYAGFENTTGFGDLRMTYLLVPFQKDDPIGLERVTFSFDATAPTGEYLLGRGAGAWLFKPAIIIKWTLAESFICYPQIHFQFSNEEANSAAGSDGLPDSENPEKDDKVQNLSLSFPAVLNIDSWNGWFSLNPLYTRSFTEQTNFFFLRMDIGKVIGRNSCASLRVTKFIAGQPRLDVLLHANLTFFIR